MTLTVIPVAFQKFFTFQTILNFHLSMECAMEKLKFIGYRSICIIQNEIKFSKFSLEMQEIQGFIRSRTINITKDPLLIYYKNKSLVLEVNYVNYHRKYLIPTFFQHLNKTYDTNVPLVLMNSFNTDEDTQKVIKKYQGFLVRFLFIVSK